MAATVNRNYPLAGINDAPDAPYAIQRLAEAVDVDMNTQVGRIATLEAAAAKASLGIIPPQLKQPAQSNGFSSGEWLVDSIDTINLKAGRRYNLKYTFDAVSTTEANNAYVMNFKKSAVGATGPAGSGLGGATVWSAPGANQGKTHQVEIPYTPTTDETIRMFITTGRVSGGSLYNMSNRTLTVTDEGAQ